jgi:hypothetical protein
MRGSLVFASVRSYIYHVALGLAKKDDSLRVSLASFASLAILVACALVAGDGLTGAGRFCELAGGDGPEDEAAAAAVRDEEDEGTGAVMGSWPILSAVLTLASHASATYSPNRPALY